MRNIACELNFGAIAQEVYSKPLSLLRVTLPILEPSLGRSSQNVPPNHSTSWLCFEAFAWEVPQKQDTLLNVTISVLGLRLRTVAKKHVNRNADSNVTICVLGLRLKTVAKNKANHNVEHSAERNILLF